MFLYYYHNNYYLPHEIKNIMNCRNRYNYANREEKIKRGILVLMNFILVARGPKSKLV